MRRLCLGGSFNPIHHGHLICARAVAESAGFDRVVLIPAASPPHKPADPTLAPAEHRLAMCRLAAAVQPDLFEVDDLELRRSGPSYTIDTVHLLKQRGWTDLAWLIGTDMASGLPNWHEPARLLNEVSLLIMARPGWAFDWSLLPPPFRILEQNVVTAPLIQISATQIRRRIADGRSIACLTPEPVAKYIAKHQLYARPLPPPTPSPR